MHVLYVTCLEVFMVFTATARVDLSQKGETGKGEVDLMTTLSLAAHPHCCWQIFFQIFLGCLELRFLFPDARHYTEPSTHNRISSLQKPFEVRSYFHTTGCKNGWIIQGVCQGLTLCVPVPVFEIIRPALWCKISWHLDVWHKESDCPFSTRGMAVLWLSHHYLQRDKWKDSVSCSHDPKSKGCLSCYWRTSSRRKKNSCQIS